MRPVFSVFGALVVVLMLYGATGSWEACAAFLVLITGFIIHQLRPHRRQAPRACRNCGEPIDPNARSGCRSCGLASS